MIKPKTFLNGFKINSPKSDSMTDCVIIHKGYQPYLKYNLEITSKNNFVYLIGDKSIKFLENRNVKFIDIEKYENSEEISFLKSHFINYNSNSFDFEWFCFARVFILGKFLKDFNLKKIFHLDSDNVLLTNINSLCFTSEIAYLIPLQQDNFRMSGSIHSALLDNSFCLEFKNLFEDVYINKNKFNLIEKKIKYHEQNNLNGGICDMTFYYLLYKEKILDIQNLFNPIMNKDSEEHIFVNNYGNGEGPSSKDNFQIKNNRLKIYSGKKILDLERNKKVSICNIHFQGASKRYLNRFTKYKLSI